MSTQLQAWGIPLYNGFSAEHLVPRPDLVIVGNAVSRDNPEAMATEQAGIPVMSFPQALAHFFIQERHSVVVTGTHGKSTTTALIAWCLQHAGYEPGFFVGAVMRNIDGTFGLGQGPHFVVEGDEYDSAYFDKGPKFLHYRPRTAVLTSLEFDHADIYRDLDHVRSAFARFIPLLPADGCLVACHDAPHVRESADHRAQRCAYPDLWLGVRRRVARGRLACRYHRHASHGARIMASLSGSFTSPLFGPHNIQNVLAAVVVTHRLGLSPAQIAAGLATYAHIKRRCEVRGVVRGITVLDDFAHHPTAVRVPSRAYARPILGPGCGPSSSPVPPRAGVPCFSTSISRRSASPIACSSPMSTTTGNSYARGALLAKTLVEALRVHGGGCLVLPDH